ncbi:MAG TPA: CoA transferase [Candidatus Binataceae bacterium]|jgi:crotonobetainyl-CoA:carnitine CoA-transferase CaiB-like acyl-CoA transferase|nr:CoA transferase [Candidatus Binataceae bacterium]
MAGPCNGLVVLDFSWGMAGGLATAVLADFGSDVVKIEPPAGDPFRKHPAWLAWNRGKKSAVLDLKTADGRIQAQQLGEQADVVLESFRPGVAHRLGIDYATLSAINPRLVYASISGWGQQGPLSQVAGYEGAVAAKSGRMMDFAGQMNRSGPTYTAVQVGTWAASQAAVRGILAATLARDSIGQGQWVQTSLLQNMIPFDLAGLVMRQLSRLDPKTYPPNSLGAAIRLPMLQYIPVRTKDGHWLQHANLMDRLFRAYLKAVGLGWVLEEELFKKAPILKHEAREALRELMLNKMQEKTLDEWMQVYVADGNVAAEPYRYAIDGMKHEQYVHNHHAVEIADPRVGRLTALGLLASLSDTPGQVGGPAPDLGQHTAEILQRISGKSRGASAITVKKVNGDDPNRASTKPLLDGITMLDFSMVIAGPYAAEMLAEMGVRVFKVDATPEREQTISTGGGMAPMNLKNYAGKEAIQVNLQSPEGQQIIHQLIARSDVLLHNFRPGVPQRLAIDWDTCRRINPRLIHVYVGTYGATGPHNRRPGAHPIPGALLGGALRQAGRANPPPPDQPMNLEEIKEVSRLLMRANEGNPDPNTSQAVATSIMLALLARARSGRGQAIEVTMLQGNAWANADEAYDYKGRPPYALPDEQCYGLNALYRLYQTSEGWVFLACVFDREWKALCKAVNRPDLLADSRFASAAARTEHDAELAEEFGKLFATRPAGEWEQLLTAAGVACVQADSSVGVFLEQHPQAIANRMTVEVESPRFGKYLRHGALINFSDAPGRLGHGPFLGEHTVRVMRDLGYTDEQIAELRSRDVIHWEEARPLSSAR